MEKVCWIFRSPNRKEHSIENVYDNLEPYVKNKFEVKKYYLPEERYFSIRKLNKNLRYVKNMSGDIYHVTGEVNFCVYVLPRKRTILTIHDYIILHQYKGLKFFLAWLFLCYLPIKRTNYLTCISRTTYEETIKRFPFCKDKITIIEDPINDIYQFHKKEFNREKPVVLLIGANPNKNLERVIPALSGCNIKVDIIGKLNDEQIKLLDYYKLEYDLCAGITNEKVLEHYVKCDLVCFASTYEGFGMPIIEAQAVGRCVITSNIEPMNGISGGAAILVDPFSVEEIKNGIMEAISNDSLREQCIKKGLENAKKYRAENIAEKYADLYKKISGI